MTGSATASACLTIPMQLTTTSGSRLGEGPFESLGLLGANAGYDGVGIGHARADLAPHGGIGLEALPALAP